MRPSHEEVLDVLAANLGFGPNKESWTDYALRHGFRGVQATEVLCCPDCGHKGRAIVGQYVYFSTLVHLVECGSSNLIYSDARIHDVFLAQYFEKAYKDLHYSSHGRR